MKRTCRRRTFDQIRAEERTALADMLERFVASIRPARPAPPVEQLEITPPPVPALVIPTAPSPIVCADGVKACLGGGE